MKIIELDNRLRLIAALAAGGGRVADVGTDHGYIPVYLAQTGLAERITASDVNPGPLQAARRSAERYGVADRIGFVLSDGLENVPRDVDTVIVAGMGGETIQGILERADWLREKDARLILQPQSKLPELTSWLRENGYALTDAALAREGDRYYPVLTVRPGEGGAEDAEALLLEKRDPLLPGYLDARIARAERIAGGIARSRRAENGAEAQELLDRLIRMKEETEKWRP